MDGLTAPDRPSPASHDHAPPGHVSGGGDAGLPAPSGEAHDARGVTGLVRRLTRKSGSNFYYAFLLLPREKRQAIYAVYAFSRAVDDAVDEAPDPAEAHARLAAWESETDQLAAGQATHPIARAVQRVRERFPIPLTSIRALLAGARMDLERSRYGRWDDLRLYCERVAAAIGHICIEIFGYRSPSARTYATDLGIALQLTNILRDLGTDARRGRIYLPLEDLARFGVAEADVLAGRRSPAMLSLLEFEASRAKSFYDSAERALDPGDRRSLLSAEVMRRIYRVLLDEIERSGFDVFDRRITLSRPRRAMIAARAWARTVLPADRRASRR